MRGIAGILRRDGGPVPNKWSQLLEQSLLLGGGLTYRFEDSIPVEHGDLHILLLSGSDLGSDPEGGARKIVLSDVSGNCAFAQWNEETLQLELRREGTGQVPLYWLDLDEAGDGLVFCTNPLPLLQIAHELELPSSLQQGLGEYLQLGFAIEGGALLSPVCSIPLDEEHLKSTSDVQILDCDISTTPAQDVLTLVQVLGKPFADFNVLSTLWQYRYAKEKGLAVFDSVLAPVSSLQQYPFLQRVLPETQVESMLQEHYTKAKIIERSVIAKYVGVELHLSVGRNPIRPVPFPLAQWFRNAQSNIGKLANDTLRSPDAFLDLPIKQKDCVALLDAHCDGMQDNSDQIFALLTLALWRQQVLA